ncbi:MAG: DUF1499 domain-containing protein [Pseudomonadota bacterium]
MNANTQRPWFHRINILAGVLLVFTVLCIVIAGPGHRFGLLDLGHAFNLTRASAIVSAVAALTGLAALIIGKLGTPSKFAKMGLAALLVGLGLGLQFYSVVKTAKSVPPIHDITTNTENPPLFVDVLPLRASAKNLPDYAGNEIAEQQKKAYPDLATISYAQNVAEVIAAAEQAAIASGWDIVAVDSDAGRLEATDTTFWYGYKDDVVVRVVSADSGSKMDVRSKSRVGQSDLGTNANRIRAFIAAISERLQ